MSDSPATVPDDHQQLLFSSSPKDEDILSLTSQMDNRHEDLHQHLIRSPPPMFPQVSYQTSGMPGLSGCIQINWNNLLIPGRGTVRV